MRGAQRGDVYNYSLAVDIKFNNLDTEITFLKQWLCLFSIFFQLQPSQFCSNQMLYFFITPLAIPAKVCSTSGLDKVKPNAKILYFHKCNLRKCNNTAL